MRHNPSSLSRAPVHGRPTCAVRHSMEDGPPSPWQTTLLGTRHMEDQRRTTNVCRQMSRVGCRVSLRTIGNIPHRNPPHGSPSGRRIATLAESQRAGPTDANQPLSRQTEASFETIHFAGVTSMQNYAGWMPRRRSNRWPGVLGTADEPGTAT